MNEVNFVKKHGFVKTKEIIEMYNEHFKVYAPYIK